MSTTTETIRDLIAFLNFHTDLYNKGTPEITDQEWDNKYMMLRDLEKTTGLIYPDSPTQHIEYNTVDTLNKFDHADFPMLSLDKTKDIDELKEFIGDKDVVITAKMDGLSCKLIYNNGELEHAATRGDGFIGEDITHNIKALQNVPLHINKKGIVIIVGEVVCNESVFQQFANEYKNPRNFAAGAIRLLNSKETAERQLSFYAWDSMMFSEKTTFLERLLEITNLGFEMVPAFKYNIHDNDTNILKDAIFNLRTNCNEWGYPIDGVVVRYNDIAYGDSLGMTAHHPRHSLAFKFEDEIVDTELEDIEYEPSRNGIMTPVAIFKPVDLLGSTISRASLFNVTIMKGMLGKRPYHGQQLKVVKSNMIIPQIVWAAPVPEYEGFDDEPDWIYPDVDCPYCGRLLTISTSESGVETLVCNNEHCPSRINNQLDYFCGKTGFDIKGLSKATLDKLVDWGWITKKIDIFKLAEHREEWIKQPGFGVKSVDKILNAIAASKDIDLPHFIAAFGITGIGLNVAKELCKHISTLDEFYQIMDGTIDCTEWDGFGRAKRNAIMCANHYEIDEVAHVVNIITAKPIITLTSEVRVCITGRLKAGSRAQVKAQYEKWGIKVMDNVSGQTNYLIANAPENSAKYKKAQELHIPIITEDEFLEIIKK